jgi:hypothetical protein
MENLQREGIAGGKKVLGPLPFRELSAGRCQERLHQRDCAMPRTNRVFQMRNEIVHGLGACSHRAWIAGRITKKRCFERRLRSGRLKS